VTQYLTPLALHPRIAPHLRFNTRVVGQPRWYRSHQNAGREKRPFVVRVEHVERLLERVEIGRSEGQEQDVLAKAVLDASSTCRTPNPLGANGLKAIGERAAASAIFCVILDVLGDLRARYAVERVLVVGSGHFAMNALLDASGWRSKNHRSR
jgi:hypothetical protein